MKGKVLKMTKVNYRVENKDQYEGRKPHTEIRETLCVDADKEDAIECAIDYFAENIDRSFIADFDRDYEAKEIKFFDYDGELIEVYDLFEIQTFAEQLNEAINSTGLKLTEIAKLIGVPYRTIQDWKLGNRTPSEFVQYEVLSKISEINKKTPERA